MRKYHELYQTLATDLKLKCIPSQLLVCTVKLGTHTPVAQSGSSTIPTRIFIKNIFKLPMPPWRFYVTGTQTMFSTEVSSIVSHLNTQGP